MIERKKIALIIPDSLPIPAVMGGAIEQLVTTLVEQNETDNKVEFIVFSPYYKQIDKYIGKYKNSTIYYIHSSKIKKKFYQLYKRVLRKILGKSDTICELYYAKVFKILKNIKPNAIVAEGGSYSQFQKISDFFGKDKIYLHIHHHLLADSSIDGIFGNVIGVSNFVKNEWIKSSEYKNINTYVVKNCVDENKFKLRITNDEKNSIRARFGFKEDDFVVLYCGRIVNVKGVKELIIAINNISNVNVKLLIIGSVNFSKEGKSDYLSEVEDLVTKSNGRIKFTGYIPNNELFKYYQSADIQVVPSLWEEAAGLVTIEGMLSELPLIVTNSGGMVEYVNNNCANIVKRGVSVSENLSKAILYLYDNPEMLKKMKQESLKKSKVYTKSNFYNEFVNIFIEKEGGK